MKYMLLIYGNEQDLSEPAREACYKESQRLVREIESRGQFVGASPLQSVATATSVRLRDGKRVVTSGPFAETAEQLGGYYLVDVPSLEEAVEIAGRIPGAKWGTVEIRPVVELEPLPQT